MVRFCSKKQMKIPVSIKHDVFSLGSKKRLKILVSIIHNKLGLSWAKLKVSLVRAVDEVTVIFNSVKVEIEVIDELSLIVQVGSVEKNKINSILNSFLV